MATKSTRPPKKAPDDLKRRSNPPPDALRDAIAAVRAAPSDADAWDEAEAQAATHQRPDDVAALYQDILSSELPAPLVLELGERAVRFHDEWFEDALPLVEVLRKMLEADPDAESAFHRLTLIFTNAGRWDELLHLYDAALTRTTEKSRRRELLDEAAHVAKDFALQPDRAIRYLEQLVPLKPHDAQLAASLERLFEKQGRYGDLVAMWTARLAALPEEQVRTTRVRIADCHLTHLAAASDAFDAVAPLAESATARDGVLDVLERIAVFEAAQPAVRQRAVEALRERYLALGQAADVVRMLELALANVGADERAALLRELVERLRAQSDEPKALRYAAELLAVEPDAEDAREQLRELAERTGLFAQRATGLTRAADVTKDPARRAQLLVEAAVVRAESVKDAAGAIDLYATVLSERTAPADVLVSVARELARLLDLAGRAPERLDVLERLATLETDDESRRTVLADAARLAGAIGAHDRAIDAWGRRLGLDGADHEALDALVELLASLGRHAQLVETLERRATAAADTDSRRADRVRIARVQAENLRDVKAAIATWSQIEADFGRNSETVAALADLLAASQQWEPLSELLEQAAAAETEPSRRAPVLARLGDLERVHLRNPEQACNRYEEALAADPRESRARDGLRELLPVAACARRAADTLARAFHATDEWQEIVGILDPRVGLATDDAERTALLLEAASLAERRGSDLMTALSAVGRALPLAPERADIERDVVRLAEATGRWDVAVAAYRGAIQACTDEARASALEMQLGAILETQTGEANDALDVFLSASRRFPADLDAAVAVVRVAARAGFWNEVAKTLVASASARTSVAHELAVEAERAADGTEAWDRATASLRAAIAARRDLPGPLGRELESLLARWHRDFRGDKDAAEAAFARAVGHDDDHVETLRMLADLQRRNPGRALVETLLRLVDATQELGTLYEAASVALKTIEDRDFVRATLERLNDSATTAWTNETSEEPDTSASLIDSNASAYAVWATNELVRLYATGGEHGLAADLLERASSMPLQPSDARDLRHRAAAIASSDAGDIERAVRLWRGLLAEVPTDARAIASLSSAYEAAERKADLLELRRHQLSIESTPDARLPLRLEIASLLVALSDAEGAIKSLRDNLAERAGHAPTIGALATILEDNQRYDELADMLAEQASKIAGDLAAAAALWTRVADIAETHLKQISRAIDAHEHAVLLVPTAAGFDALARLSAKVGDHLGAVRWLERRLALSTGDERAATVARLADAHLRAGQQDQALQRLEDALREEPSAAALRKALCDLYRGAGNWEALARVLTEGADQAPDDASRAAQLREAAEIHLRRLGSPSRAVPLLERAMPLSSDDRLEKTMLAEALRLSGRLDEAKSLLEALVESFGRRRPPERAQMHLELALIARAKGDVEEALGQLDVASKMDVGSANIMQQLADLAREHGELERAERAYRALLLIVRRQGGDDQAAASEGVRGASEVLFVLSDIARERGDEERAQELLESAFETAASGDDQALRFEHMLRGIGRHDLLLRSLENRLSHVTEPVAAAAVHVELSELHTSLGRPEEALGSRLTALGHAPSDAALHESTSAMAVSLGVPQRYADELAKVAGRVATNGDASLASELYLRLGRAYESDLDDKQKAADAYAQAEATGERVLEALQALDRLYTQLGDTASLVRVLRRVVEAPAGDDANAQNESVYRLAALELASTDSIEAGAASLSWALDRDPQYDRALQLLRKAALASPTSPPLVALFERVARAMADDDVLLEAIERAAALSETGLELLREGVETAQRLGYEDRAEALLRRAVELARERSSTGEAVWALVALADRRQAAGDVRQAFECLRDAAEAAEGADAYGYAQRAAELASGPVGDPAAAAAVLERLRQRDPTDRSVWEPLLDLYRRLGDTGKLDELIAQTIDAVYEPADRNRLRLERARLLLSSSRDDDAVLVLRDALDEDPGHADVGALLMDLYEKHGQSAELAELLFRQLDVARDRNDAALVSSVSLRLGKLLMADPERRFDALDVYRKALEWVPNDRAILEELVASFTPEDDQGERADLLERLVAAESGEKAQRLALELVQAREALGDADGVIRAMDLALRTNPADIDLREKLEGLYREREEWTRLAELIAFDAENRPNPSQARERFEEAMAIYRDRLLDLRAAADVLGRARAKYPDDYGLLAEYAIALAGAGDHAAGVDALSQALASGLELATHAQILGVRGDLLAGAGDLDASLRDYEDAFAMGGSSFAPALVAALARVRDDALARQDRDRVRETTLRLVQVLPEAGDPARALDLLEQWIDIAPKDKEAIAMLADLDIAQGRWLEAASRLAALADLSQGEERIDAVLKFAEATQQGGQPGNARMWLERVSVMYPDREDIRTRLRQIYEASGAFRELGDLYITDASQAADDAARYQALVRAGEMFIRSPGDAELAMPPLEQALALRPGDQDATLLLSDAYVGCGRLEDAANLLDPAIRGHKGRRSRELGALQHRMARVAYAMGDRRNEMAWLTVALESDPQSGLIASELAEVAMELQAFDIATKALRAITLMKNPGPMTRAEAFLRQGMIAHQQGDAKKAVFMANKALSEDPDLSAAREFITQLGG